MSDEQRNRIFGPSVIGQLAQQGLTPEMLGLTGLVAQTATDVILQTRAEREAAYRVIREQLLPRLEAERDLAHAKRDATGELAALASLRQARAALEPAPPAAPEQL